jgi:hypothetical protein
MPLCPIVHLIGSSLSLTHSLEEGNTMRDHNLIKVPMLVHFLPAGMLKAYIAQGAFPWDSDLRVGLNVDGLEYQGQEDVQDDFYDDTTHLRILSRAE